MAEREAEVVATSIRDSIFCVANMSSVGFLDSTGKTATITDPDNHPRDISYYKFHSSVNPNTVDPRVPNTVYHFEFSLRLPRNSLSSFVNLSLPNASIVSNQSSDIIFNATLGGLSDDQLKTNSASALRDMLSAQRDLIPVSATSTPSGSFDFSIPNSSTMSMTTTSTQKIDMVH